MKNGLHKNYFIGSLCLHLAIIIFFTISSLYNDKHRTFVVFGAHSKKPTKVFLKSPNKKVQAPKSSINGSKNKKKPSKPAPKPLKKKAEKPKPKPVPKPAEKKEVKAKVPQKTKKRESKLLDKPTEKIKEEPKKEEKVYEEEQDDSDNDEELPPKKEKKEKKPIVVEEEEDLFEEDIDDEDDDDVDGADQEDEAMELNLLALSDKEHAAYHKEIQKEVQRLWRPPLGAPRGTECLVKFFISEDGNVEKFEFIKRSNMLIYDLSIQRIAMNFKFHKPLWGRNFLIDFQQ